MVKIFTATNRAKLEREINDYAKKHNLRIISTSLAILQYGLASEEYYISVVFEENKI